MAARRHWAAAAAALLLLLAVVDAAAVASSLRPPPAQQAAKATTKRSKSASDCGPRSNGELCRDATACCSKAGKCGKTKAFCGEQCISGKCWPKSQWATGAAAPSPSPKPAAPKPASPKATSPKPASPKPAPSSPVASAYTVTTANGSYKISIKDGAMGFAPCPSNTTIAAILKPVYGAAKPACNATASYRIVAASCLGQPGCMLRASTEVFGNPCPAGTAKTLNVTYVCAKPATPPAPAVNPTKPTNASTPTTTKLPASTAGTPEATPVTGRYATLWGRSGESWNPAGQLADWSYAGYAGNDQPIPQYDVVVDVTKYGAVADGKTDNYNAFQKAIDAASAQAASAPSGGAAVWVPAGTYALKKEISITKSKVVLRGAGAGKTKIVIPTTLSKIHGKSPNWSFGGGFISIVGKKVDSSKSANYLATIAADARRGDTRIKVSTTTPFRVGQWVRLWMRKPGNQSLNRIKPNATEELPPCAATTAQRVTGNRKMQLPTSASGASATDANSTASSDFPKMFQDPYLQAAVEAAAAAETAAAEAAYAAGPEPTSAGALSTDPAAVAAAEAAEAAALNPLSLDPMLLAAARYSTEAMASEIAAGEVPQELVDKWTGRNSTADSEDGSTKAPAVAVVGSLDYYLYGDNKVVDSGTNFKVFPNSDHIRFASRVAAIGNGYIDLERPLPYDARTKWEPVLHKFAPTVEHSGIEGMTVEFGWTSYPEHFSAGGANAIVLYDVANCWVRDVTMVNVDNGVNLCGVDFITVNNTRFSVTTARGTGSAKGKHGHHALWTSRSSDVLFTNFWMEDPWVHDVSLDQFAELTVYSSGGGSDLNFDCHRAGTHSNLFSNINLGAGSRAFHSGGASSRGAHSGANNTWYNIYQSSNKPVPLPACSYGPLLTFIGNFGKPSTSNKGDSGARRRLTAADNPFAPLPTGAPAAAASSASAATAANASSNTPQLAVAIAGGPIIIPEEDPAAAAEAQALGLGTVSINPAPAPVEAPFVLPAMAAPSAPAPAPSVAEEEAVSHLLAQDEGRRADKSGSATSPSPAPQPAPSPAHKPSRKPAHKPAPNPSPSPSPSPAPATHPATEEAGSGDGSSNSTGTKELPPLPDSALEDDAQAGGADSGSDKADALAASDCANVGWTVMQFPYKKDSPLLPADLASAQLAARKARTAARLAA